MRGYFGDTGFPIIRTCADPFMEYGGDHLAGNIYIVFAGWVIECHLCENVR
ncbi:hypothetical protein XBO1_1710046 [Xenorhabdus bovienii str. oregonense]|uniref:Uncharacterized protein n=1 Tax=Xenorhabdus bovienii str. oregonense TaxID=1398202 RepID=A0A077P215_XENBV|nr:hypothetical protein XBO1_1710046 [Xenorhabdus bovienii str. oregonense]